MKKQKRSDAREMVFTALFGLDENDDIKELVNDLISENPDSELDTEYITSVLEGIREKKPELEEEISKRLKKGWTINRISKSSLIILTLAVYEMKYVLDVPPKVAINEAVNLAKKYGADEDSRFVNGVLGNIFRTLQ